MKVITAHELIVKDVLESSKAVDYRKMIHHQLYRLFADEMERHDMLEISEEEVNDLYGKNILFKATGYVMSEKELMLIIRLLKNCLEKHRPSPICTEYLRLIGRILTGEVNIDAIYDEVITEYDGIMKKQEDQDEKN